MGRKALPPDEGMQKTLSVRISEWLTKYLEQARDTLEKDGQKTSTSDIARQLLVEAAERAVPHGFTVDKEEMLRGIMRAARDERPLTRNHYAFLADYAHRAYQFTRRDFVRADLLINLLRAFAAFMELRNSTYPELAGKDQDQVQERDQVHDRDRYYFGNLGTKAQQEKSISAAVQRAIELVNELVIPYRTTGEFMSRTLEVALRDEPILADDAVDECLRPYLRGLLLLALTAFAYEHERAVDSVEELHELTDRLKIRAALNHSNEKFSLSFYDGSGVVTAVLTPKSAAWSIHCTYERLVDLVALLNLDRATDSDYFNLLHNAELDGIYYLSAKGTFAPITVRFTPSEKKALQELIAGVMSQDEYARVFRLLESRFGAI
ncbi:MAG: hypothetical protein ING37_02220, partial [Rhodocyclaceae bacterium]|nr:hypothetical protein [Rhodocyclaceae bacterium]